MIMDDMFIPADQRRALSLLEVLDSDDPVDIDTLTDPWVKLNHRAFIEIHPAVDVFFDPRRKQPLSVQIDSSAIIRTVDTISVAIVGRRPRHLCIGFILNNGMCFQVPVAYDPRFERYRNVFHTFDKEEPEDDEEVFE